MSVCLSVCLFVNCIVFISYKIRDNNTVNDSNGIEQENLLKSGNGNQKSTEMTNCLQNTDKRHYSEKIIPSPKVESVWALIL